MQFSGVALRGILAVQRDVLDVRDQNGGPVALGIPAVRAVKGIDLERYVGVGNHSRIRYLRPMPAEWLLNLGSKSTRPVRGDGTGKYYGAGQLMGNPDFLREHSPR